MASLTGIFPQIATLEALREHLSPPLAPDEWGVLALDFDQTLVQAKPTLGDENWYHFLKQQNRERGIETDAHYRWSVAIRSKVSYEACEPADRINALIQAFREHKWSTKILTSRGMDMRRVTEKHLHESRLCFSLDDVLFKKRSAESNALLQKDESLLQWMESQPQWHSHKTIRVLFADDLIKYCGEVARLADRVQKTTVHAMHFVGALPNPDLSEEQMNRLVVQLDAYRQDQPIEESYRASDLHQAMRNLEIQTVSQSSLYSAMVKIAERQALPFTSTVS